MSTKLSCPECGSFKLKSWILGKYKCGGCSIVFPRNSAIRAEYVPARRYRTRKISDADEKKTAKSVGGRRTLASGALPIDKADVKAHDLRVECKSTEKKSYSLKKADLEKLAGQAGDEEMPVFSIEFRGQPSSKYYVLDEGWFLELLELKRQNDDQND